MCMQTLFEKIISLFVKKIFEMLPKQNVMRYLPKRNIKTPGGI